MSSSYLARLMSATGLLLGLLAMLLTAQPAATQTGDSSIEVHNRICPEGYEGENFFEDCHDNVLGSGYEFTFTNVDTGETYQGATNANGDVGFANLSAGTYTITGGPPGEFTETFAYCAIGTEENPNREQVNVEYVTGGIQFYLPADTNVICDWYWIPIGQGPTPTATEAAEPTAESSIEVHARVCPEGYEGTDYFNACHDNPVEAGLPFTFVNQDTGATYEGTTNENGNVGFANLNQGTFTITGGAPGEFTERFVYCSSGVGETSDLSPIEVSSIQGGVQFFLPASTNVVCDWYIIPQGQQGQPTPTAAPETFDLPIYKLLCQNDPGQSALQDFVTVGTVPAGCEQFAGVSVTVTDGDGNVIGSCVTEANAPCYVTVTVGTTIFATEDLATVPEGYAPLQGETHEVAIEPATEASVLFTNVQTAPTATVVPTATVPPPTPTPAPEGRPLAIVMGTCPPPGELGETVVELPDLIGPELGPDEDAEVILAETSTGTIDFTLQELMDSEYSLVAYSDDGAMPVACTPLEGQINADGELVLGLQEVNESGDAGIVYLAPTVDGNQTQFSVFFAEGLAEEDPEATPTPVG
ncbi:MAG TPA: carboxypeptidase-like regulatory domain-containing protein [Thermomicrobiales bacterium]|nr:carboxypeptidase-like regulatory domain-containing protein [Thermomicrobiales bacterium]